MASLYKKVISGKPYWYLREMARVDGKPKMVSEQKRADLRLVGLGLVVTRDGGVPLAHAYPGNRPDVTQFATMIDLLTARHAALADQTGAPAPAQMTVVFDAGQNSVANFTHLSDSGPAFVGSIPPSDVADLLALPATGRRIVDANRFGALSAIETRRVVHGTDRRVVLTHSPTLHTAQQVGFAQTLAKALRQLKDPHVVSFPPMHHWTEHNIRVHTFTRVHALQIGHLMRRRADQAGLHLSVRELLDQLAGIAETVLIYLSTGGRPKARRMLTETTATQDQLTHIFDLTRWAPRS